MRPQLRRGMPAPISLLILATLSFCSVHAHAQNVPAKSAYTVMSTTGNGDSLFLGDQAPGNQNGGNTVAGINAGGKLTGGSTGLGGQKNVIIGTNAGSQATTARESVMIGNGACGSITGNDTGAEDSIVTCIGSIAGAHLTNSVISSAFIGQKSGLDLTTSYYDTLIGNHSGVRLNSSSRSTFIGQFSGAADNLGIANNSDVTYRSIDNTIVGAEAAEFPFSNADKTGNTAFGTAALLNWGAATGNSVFGTAAGSSITDGSYNTAIGWQSLFGRNGPTTGNYNIAVGALALPSLTTGRNNIGIGDNAGVDITTGSFNLMFGSNVGNRIGTGTGNVLFWGGAGNRYNYSGVVGIGSQTCVSPDDGMVCIGSHAGANNAGTGNLFIGRNAGQYSQGGSDNLVIGQDAGQYLGATESGNTLIGNRAEVNSNCNNTVQIGSGKNDNCGSLQFGTQVLVNTNGTHHAALYTPSSSSSSCNMGDFADDANYHYVCTAPNTWKRVALSAF